jgi:Zn-dependent peptidase ImmA (M78 family)/transcriptional regulator with XRE-family HTH domain
MTQSELAVAIGVTQSKISKLEDGLLPTLSAEDLENLSRVLDRPHHFFMQWGESRAACASFYRKKSALPVKLLNRCDARMNIQRIQIEKLVKDAEMETKSLPRIDPDECIGGPVEVARLVRKTWGMPRGPVKNLTELVEDAGIVVVPFDFGTNKLDGLSVLGDGRVPIIFINPAFPAGRQRFTLAHELGHIVMHTIPKPEMEDEAHAFAGEFLMPEADIISSFYPIGLDQLARLKLHWRVSMQALLKRGCDLGAITERYGRYLWMQMGKFGYRNREPHEEQIPHEHPSLLKELVDLHLSDLEYTKHELAHALMMSERDFEQTYQAQGGIRVVK